MPTQVIFALTSFLEVSIYIILAGLVLAARPAITPFAYRPIHGVVTILGFVLVTIGLVMQGDYVLSLITGSSALIAIILIVIDLKKIWKELD